MDGVKNMQLKHIIQSLCSALLIRHMSMRYHIGNHSNLVMPITHITIIIKKRILKPD